MVLISTCATACLCLAATVMILINGMVLNHSVEAKVIVQNSMKLEPQIALRHQKHNLDRNKCVGYFKSENGKMSRLLKNRKIFIQNLEGIIIKLKNVIDYYDLKKHEIQDLYPGAAACGLNKCGNFRNVLPKCYPVTDFKYKKFQKGRGLKKLTAKLLSEFHSDVQIFNESFQELINFETSPSISPIVHAWSNRARLEMLHYLQTDIKTLIVETKTVVTNKRLNFSHKPILPLPKYQIDLMITEWRVIQHSKKFLKCWRKIFRKVCRCWKN